MMLAKKTYRYVHPESNDVIEVQWSDRAWNGAATKFVGGDGSEIREEFFTTLRDLLQNGWIQLPNPPETLAS